MEMALETLEALPAELSKPVSADIDVQKIREAASAHFEDLTEDQKQAARSLFDTVDEDKNRKISIHEFRTFLSDAGLQTVNPDDLFAEPDKDDSKSLSFEELVTFFYVLSRDEYKHLLKRRPSTDVHGQQASIASGTVRGANDKARIAPGTARGANDKVREAASAHVKDLTEDQKKEAKSLFDTMDKNEDGDISVDEFRIFLSDAGLQTVDPDGLFAELDKDASETLSFEELVTFFYVLSRDENKDRWKRKPSTDVHGQEGHKWTKFLPRLYDKFKGTYKLDELGSENSCTII